MTTKPIAILFSVACAITLAACDKSTKDAQANALRNASDAAGSDLDNKADAVEDAGATNSDIIEERADAAAEAMREDADALRERGERQANAVEAGTIGATTSTDRTTTTTAPDPNASLR